MAKVRRVRAPKVQNLASLFLKKPFFVTPLLLHALLRRALTNRSEAVVRARACPCTFGARARRCKQCPFGCPFGARKKICYGNQRGKGARTPHAHALQRRARAQGKFDQFKSYRNKACLSWYSRIH